MTRSETQPAHAPFRPDPAEENPYQSPAHAAVAPYGAPAAQNPHEDDIALTQPTGMVKAGAILTLSSGGLTALVGLQLLVAVTLVGSVLKLVPYLLLAAGVATMFLGLKTLRTRGWGAIGATVACGLITLGMGYWVLLAAASGFFSLLALLLPPLALVSTVFAGLAVGPCLRADAARLRLSEAGVELTF